VNQKECEQDKVDRTKKGAEPDSTGRPKESILVSTIVAVHSLQIKFYTVSQINWATFIFTVTLANVGRLLKFFQCRNQKEMVHNNNEKFPTVA